MAIRIRRCSEPLTPASWNPRESPYRDSSPWDVQLFSIPFAPLIAARSQEGRILEYELTRYCSGEINGRSFLIAGHRGAGKTTMVAHAIHQMIQGCDEGTVPLRPLPVFLHGPSLFASLPDTPDNAHTDKPPASNETGTPAIAIAIAPTVAPKSPAGAEAASSPGGASKRVSSDTSLEAQANMALEQIILGLHRAVVKEYADAYRKAAEYWGTSPINRRSPLPPAGKHNRHRRFGEHASEWAELAAQFEVELMEDPPAARLRQFYCFIDALDDEEYVENVAFYATYNGLPASKGVLASKGTLFNNRPQRDQAARELVALNGICSAHQRISGRLNEEERRNENNRREASTETNVDTSKLDALRPVATLVSGAVVGGGAAVASGSVAQGALLAALTVIAGSFVLRHSSSTHTRRERKLDSTFIPDLSLRTLDRLLPTLLRRLMAAGLAPVFVIDELDKVDELSDRLLAMVNRLKKLMAENVFSCFLTDRGYLEYLAQREREQAYGVEYSYFSHPLLVAFQPADFDAFLTDLLDSDSDASKADCEVLKWVLRHRSTMHAMALNREIAAFSTTINPDGAITPPPPSSTAEADTSTFHAATNWINIPTGAVRSDRLYRIDATMQVVIEAHLNTEDVIAWLKRWPAMRQTLLDALYYLSREWLGDMSDVELADSDAVNADPDDKVRPKLRAYLEGRMNVEQVEAKKEPGDVSADPPDKPKPDATMKRLSARDMDFFTKLIRNIARDLSDQRRLPFDLQWWMNPNLLPVNIGASVAAPSQVVLYALFYGDESVLIADEGTRFRFRYTRSGDLRDQSRHAPPTQAAPQTPSQPRKPADIAKDAAGPQAFIETWVSALGSLLASAQTDASLHSGVLFQLFSEQLRILPTTPAWTPVQASIERLSAAQFALGNANELESDVLAVNAFEKMLRASFPTLAVVLTTAAFIGALGGEATLEDGIMNGLRALSTGLRFAALDSDGVRDATREFRKQIVYRLSVAVPDDPPVEGGVGESITDVTSRAAVWFWSGRERSTSLSWAAIVLRAWQGFLERLQTYSTPITEHVPRLEEIICAASGLGPSRTLGLSIAGSTLGGWTSVLLEALVSGPASSATKTIPRGQEPAKPADDGETPIPVLAYGLRYLGAQCMSAEAMHFFVESIRKVRKMDTDALASLGLAAGRSLSSANVPGSRVIIVVRTPGSSVTSTWTSPVTRAFFLVVTPQQLPQALPLVTGAVGGRNEPNAPPAFLLVWENDLLRKMESDQFKEALLPYEYVDQRSLDTGVRTLRLETSSPEYPDALALYFFGS
ncbi:hypothetical protein P0D69_39985 [Paraburkholderia sediminicola]|uniref:hypothetical protein n=1 Tax=Paraburkholderia sediminicola TaxID=458836 RepID=UPI0038BBEB59